MHCLDSLGTTSQPSDFIVSKPASSSCQIHVLLPGMPYYCSIFLDGRSATRTSSLSTILKVRLDCRQSNPAQRNSHQHSSWPPQPTTFHLNRHTQVVPESLKSSFSCWQAASVRNHHLSSVITDLPGIHGLMMPNAWSTPRVQFRQVSQPNDTKRNKGHGQWPAKAFTSTSIIHYRRTLAFSPGSCRF